MKQLYFNLINKSIKFVILAILGIIPASQIVAQVENDGCGSVSMNIAWVFISDGDGEVAGEEHRWKFWGRDNADLDGNSWNGGDCIEVNVGGIFISQFGWYNIADINLFTSTYGNIGTTPVDRPLFVELRGEYWEDDNSGDDLLGCGSSCVYDNCGTIQDSDDHHRGPEDIHYFIPFRNFPPNSGANPIDVVTGGISILNGNAIPGYIPTHTSHNYGADVRVVWSSPIPDPISANPMTISCNTGLTPISMVTSGAVFGGDFVWYEQSSGNQVGTGDIITVFPITTTTYEVYSVNNGIESFCYREITITFVQDTIAPDIFCPADDTIGTGFGLCSSDPYTFSVPAFDNCDGPLTANQINGFPSGTNLPLGTYFNTFQVFDSDGNANVCSFSVTVQDQAPPTINCPPDIQQLLTVNCNNNVNYSLPTFSDDCPGTTLSFVSGLVSGSNFPVGTTTITYRAIDAAGNTSDCTFNISLLEIISPSIACPASITLDADPGTCTASFENLSIITVAGPNDNLFRHIADTSNFNTTLSFPLQVSGFNITSATGLARNPVNGELFALVHETGLSSSNSTLLIQIDQLTGNSTYIGNTNDRFAGITFDDTGTLYAITDDIAAIPEALYTLNTSTAGKTFRALLGGGDDGEAICFNPDDGFIYHFSGENTPIFERLDPNASFAATNIPLSGATTGQIDDLIYEGNGVFLGVNSATMVMRVTTNGFVTNTGLNTNHNATALEFNSEIIGTDNCPGFTINQTSGIPLDSSYQVGTTFNSFTIQDAAGNFGSCSFSVTVNDLEDPIISCPADITQGTDTGECSAVVTFISPTILDNCPNFNSFQIVGIPSNSIYPIGTLTNSFVVNDVAGNADTCSFSVTVIDNQGPDLFCPANISVGTDPGICSATVNYSILSFDNCTSANVSLVSGNGSGSTFNVGTVTETYQSVDVAGNSSTCSFNITVLDDEPPVVLCPADISVATTSPTCSEVITYSPPTFSDNCPGVTISVASGLPSGSSFFGLNTIAYTVIDAGGNFAFCSFNIDVTDAVNPVISCPANITTTTDSGLCTAVVTYIPPVGTDNCPGPTTTLFLGLGPGGSFNLGNNTEIYQVTDPSGNTGVCNFTVVVQDAEAPIIVCPADITVSTDSGSCNATVTYTPPVGTDNCIGVTTGLVAGQASGGIFPSGTTIVSYQANDASGNTGLCSFNIVVEDNENPTANCPPDIVDFTNNNACTGVVNYLPPTGTDNCPGVLASFSSGLGSGGAFPVGVSTEIYTITDAAGNSTICSFTITITDNLDPTITCPSNLTVAGDSGSCNATVTYTTPVGTDNCPGASTSLSSGFASGSVFTAGNNTVSYVVTDAGGNSATCSFDVFVIDGENPVVNCPSDITVMSDSGVCGAIVTYTPPTGSDNCLLDTTTLASGPSSGSLFPAGVSVVTYVATDAAGNSATCSFNVIVEDTDAPVLSSCPADISLTTSTFGCFEIVSWTPPTAVDNCPGFVSVSASMPPPALISVGTTVITYTATDVAGNTSTCNFNVTVTDSVAPSILNCPNNIVQFSNPGTCQSLVVWGTPTISDNCPGGTLSSNFSSLSFFPVGTTTVVYTATDASGNTGTCSFDVTVLDLENPTVVGCPTSLVVPMDSGVCGAIVTWNTLTASDNCPGATVSQISGLSSGGVFPAGNNLVSFIATDAAGNSAACNFNVAVLPDNITPTINCPSDITIPTSAGGGCQGIGTWNVPTVTDNCPNAQIIQTGGLPQGSLFTQTNTTITYLAIDGAGNSATCSFNIVLEDTIPPVLMNCPSDTTLIAGQFACLQVVSWTAPTATDNCSVPTVVGSVNPPGILPVGDTLVVYTATDAAGNSSTCSFTVTIVDSIGPIFNSCPSSTTQFSDPGVCGTNVLWTAPVVTDNCPGFTVSNNFNPNDFFVVGTTLVTYTAVDASGNSAVCSFNINIVDNEAPVINCPTNINVPMDPGVCGAVISWNVVTATDNCPGFMLSKTLGPANGSLFPQGVANVSYLVTDASGNTADCDFTVTVGSDVEPPTIVTCPSDITVPMDSLNCGATVTWNPPTGTDNCPGVTFTPTGIPLGSFFTQGTQTILYTASDASGNTSNCSFDVTVLSDGIPPVIFDCPIDTVVPMSTGLCGASWSWIEPTASDNCSSASIFQSSGPLSGGFFPEGLTTVSYTASDGFGNTDSCVFTVTVLSDMQPPVINICPQDVNTLITSGCSLFVSVTPAFATDNCALASLTHDSPFGVGNTNATGTYPLGTTTVTWTATDINGNTGTCVQNITISDITPPTLTCPADVTVSNLPGNCQALVVVSNPVISDNCPGVVVTNDFNNTNNASGSYPFGLTVVNWTATDAAGNTAQCSHNVFVTEIDPPVAACTTATVFLGSTGTATLLPSQVDGGSFDLCSGIDSLAVSPSTFTTADTGAQSVTLYVYDTAGNVDSCLTTVTVIPFNAVAVGIKVFLQGAYNIGTGLMNDSLRFSPSFPLTEPYTGLGYTHVGPGGGETITNPTSVLSVFGNDAIVDWVFVELRSDSTTVIATRSGLIQRDGDVVDMDGVTPLDFFGVTPGNYYVVVQHRNHLSVMTGNTVPLTVLPATVDFIGSATPTWGSNAQAFSAFTGFNRMLWAGDTNGDKVISLSGVVNDPFPIFFRVIGDPNNLSFSQTYVVFGYFLEDLNIDGKVILSGVENDPFILNLNVLTHPDNFLFSQTFQIFDQVP